VTLKLLRSNPIDRSCEEKHSNLWLGVTSETTSLFQKILCLDELSGELGIACIITAITIKCLPMELQAWHRSVASRKEQQASLKSLSNMAFLLAGDLSSIDFEGDRLIVMGSIYCIANAVAQANIGNSPLTVFRNDRPNTDFLDGTCFNKETAEMAASISMGRVRPEIFEFENEFENHILWDFPALIQGEERLNQ